MNNENQELENNEQKQRKTIRKAGRTILVNNISDGQYELETFNGLQNSTLTHNKNVFYVFDTIENAKVAFKTLKQNKNIRVKFAYYKLFFKMSDLNDDVDYTTLKKEHINWISLNSGGNVLYYKQYRSGGTHYLGCGDFTVDTKESLEKLLNKDELKTFSFDKYTGTHFKYNKKSYDVQAL